MTPFSLNGSRRVRDTVNIDEGESCTDYSLLDAYGYANREQHKSSENIINMNFVQFAATYEVVNNEPTKLPENIDLSGKYVTTNTVFNLGPP